MSEKERTGVLKRVLPEHDNVKDTQGVSNKGFKKLTVISQLAFKLGSVISISTIYSNFENRLFPMSGPGIFHETRCTIIHILIECVCVYRYLYI